MLDDINVQNESLDLFRRYVSVTQGESLHINFLSTWISNYSILTQALYLQYHTQLVSYFTSKNLLPIRKIFVMPSQLFEAMK